MAARSSKKAAATPVNDTAKQADESGIYLDPVLAERRDAELKAMGSTELTIDSPAASLDPVLEKARDAEIKSSKSK